MFCVVLNTRNRNHVENVRKNFLVICIMLRRVGNRSYYNAISLLSLETYYLMFYLLIYLLGFQRVNIFVK